MVQALYSIFDRSVEKYASPFTAENDSSAYRAFGFALEQAHIDFLGDYDLVEVGTYDDDAGVPQYIGEHRIVANGDDLRPQREAAAARQALSKQDELNKLLARVRTELDSVLKQLKEARQARWPFRKK